MQSELALLGHDLAESTIAKYIPRQRKPPSQTWRTFLDNHVGSLVSIDFFVVPTVTFRLLYGFVVLRHDRREVHFNVTAHPNAEWVARQMIEAFPFDTAPKYLIRDRDGVYGDLFRRRLESLGIDEVLTAPRSPWQNPYVERLIGTIRRECLDHLIVLNERHLYRILKQFFDYYHRAEVICRWTGTRRSRERSNRQRTVASLPNPISVDYITAIGAWPRSGRRLKVIPRVSSPRGQSAPWTKFARPWSNSPLHDTVRSSPHTAKPDSAGPVPSPPVHRMGQGIRLDAQSLFAKADHPGRRPGFRGRTEYRIASPPVRWSSTVSGRS